MVIESTASYASVMEELVHVIQALSHSRDLNEIVEIIRTAARELTGADGATFVLRDRDQCHYVEENAIGPLWKGKRFPLSNCISGWVMLNKEAAIINDIYQDERIPHDAYRPTFVKSLVMVPVRKNSPIAAIGNYWAEHHTPTEQELAVLQALADTASVAMENASLYSELQSKIKALEESNGELSHFAWIASHDLQEPLRTIRTQIEMFERTYTKSLDEGGKKYLWNVITCTERLQSLVKDLLVHASIFKSAQFKAVNLKPLIESVVANDLKSIIAKTGARVTCDELPWVWGNEVSLARLFQNLISNAIKFTKKGTLPEIKITCVQELDKFKFCVADNGIGITPEYHKKIFELFQRQHSRDEYPGSGIGLATCKKIVELHGGKIWVDPTPANKTGSTFCFTLSPSTATRR